MTNSGGYMIVLKTLVIALKTLFLIFMDYLLCNDNCLRNIRNVWEPKALSGTLTDERPVYQRQAI